MFSDIGWTEVTFSKRYGTWTYWKVRPGLWPASGCAKPGSTWRRCRLPKRSWLMLQLPDCRTHKSSLWQFHLPFTYLPPLSFFPSLVCRQNRTARTASPYLSQASMLHTGRENGEHRDTVIILLARNII